MSPPIKLFLLVAKLACGIELIPADIAPLYIPAICIP